MATREWVLKKNCSISPRQLAKAYLAICCASLMVASYFTWQGAWLIMVFAVLEMAAVATAFLYFGRHATDRECIALNEAELVVELVRAEKISQFRLDPWRTRVAMPSLRHGLIGLEGNAGRVEVGRFLTERKRREFARELNQELLGYRLSL
ncbi:MAG: DUF2244 domain-containing protein [Betaproteobacteria bacterium]|nr:DUF2244 domain-containing protein [Betaproteobacteria bacterium]